jgi:hypothetical protein
LKCFCFLTHTPPQTCNFNELFSITSIQHFIGMYEPSKMKDCVLLSEWVSESVCVCVCVCVCVKVWWCDYSMTRICLQSIQSLCSHRRSFFRSENFTHEFHKKPIQSALQNLFVCFDCKFQNTYI